MVQHQKGNLTGFVWVFLPTHQATLPELSSKSYLPNSGGLLLRCSFAYHRIISDWPQYNWVKVLLQLLVVHFYQAKSPFLICSFLCFLVQQEILKIIDVIWRQLISQRQQVLEDTYKMDLSVKAGDREREVKILEITPLWEEMMAKAWQNFIGLWSLMECLPQIAVALQ